VSVSVIWHRCQAETASPPAAAAAADGGGGSNKMSDGHEMARQAIK